MHVTDREAIRSALQQVQAGEITAERATELLLAAENAESLESLLQRLGDPPLDVVNSWCDQMRSIARMYEADLGEPLPRIELDRWAITAQGDLLVDGRRWEISDDAPPSSGESGPDESGPDESGPGESASQVSLDRILEFQRRYVPEHQLKVRAHSIEASQIDSKQSPQLENRSADPSRNREPVTKSNLRRNIRVLMIAATAACAVVAGFVLLGEFPTTDSVAKNTSRPNSSVPNSSVPNSSVPSSAPLTSIAPNRLSGLPTTDNVGAESSDELITLETFEPTSDLETDPDLDTELSMSLDGLVPDIDTLGSIPSRAERNADSDTAADGEDAIPDKKNDSKTKSAVPGKGQIADDEPIPDESPQQTHESTVMSVRLADPDDVDSTVALADRPLSELKIDFPYAVPLEVKQQDDIWSIIDTTKDVSIVKIRTTDGATEMSWTKTAKQSPNVSALVHGRLTDASGSTIYLRPTTESEPWTFTFATSDVMPTWNLGDWIPPKVTHLEVDFDLPDDIEYGWVEPIESSELRRTRGTAVVNIAGDEDVSLGIRYDIRCNRKLACRMRFAARLDPSMSWQIVSSPLVAQFSDQLHERSMAIAKENDRLGKVYRQLSRREAKRYIRNKQEHVKDLSRQVETAANRVAKLQTLMARLESEAAIGFRVWVEWPDTEQTLLLASRRNGN